MIVRHLDDKFVFGKPTVLTKADSDYVPTEYTLPSKMEKGPKFSEGISPHLALSFSFSLPHVLITTSR